MNLVLKRFARVPRLFALLAGVALAASFSPSQSMGQGIPEDAVRSTLQADGLNAPVEILRDRWGVNHIYADSEYDLFFAQGYAAARDRLFQFEVWRRQATGTVAEILGPDELERDIGVRLFRYRGDMELELNHYHDRGVEIIHAFVDGVNAYIDETRRNPELLPVEFGLLGIVPEHWTPYEVISRHQGLLGNIGSELNYGRAVHHGGEAAVHKAANFHPGKPDIALDPAIDGALLDADILGLYNAFRRPVRFTPEDLVEGSNPEDFALLESQEDPFQEWQDEQDVGSNNWIVAGNLSESGYPLMANDPHRAQSAPSLRYMVHLVGPGWDVIGGGEPEIPGVSIGHNGYGAWGLTVFSTDGEDLYVYETHPDDPNQYRYRDGWETMSVIREEIPVRGQAPHQAEFKYTRHGPVVFEDADNNVAYAVRAAWLEPGGAPYLASLRMDQAKTWEEFRLACTYSNIPGENMIWADREGNIGWQAVGIAPVRRNWSGLVPVPGDGRYEWDGYLPINAKPNVLNPPEGFFATANSNLTPEDFPYRDAIGWEWSDPYRWARANEVLANGAKHSMADMMALQTDVLSIPARTLIPLLRHVQSSDRRVEEARRRLLGWDHQLLPESVAAGIYVAWERRLQRNVHEHVVPESIRGYVRGLSMVKVIDHLLSPDGSFGSDPIGGRDALLLASLEEAVDGLRESLGGNMDRWQYGQTDYKHATIYHPLSRATTGALSDRFTVGPHPRGGNSYTLNNTGGGNNQTSGASFRMIVDTGDWDRTLGTNTPGQSGDPDSPFYENLFELWANDRFFPMFYSRDLVEGVTAERVILEPGSS